MLDYKDRRKHINRLYSQMFMKKITARNSTTYQNNRPCFGGYRGNHRITLRVEPKAVLDYRTVLTGLCGTRGTQCTVDSGLVLSGQGATNCSPPASPRLRWPEVVVTPRASPRENNRPYAEKKNSKTCSRS